MNKVAIMTNLACMFADEAKKKCIAIIPFHTRMEGKDYLYPQVVMERFCALPDKKENLPTTAPFSVVECFPNMAGPEPKRRGHLAHFHDPSPHHSM